MGSTCDIIIPVWNNLALTKACVDSVVAHTGPGYRLIVIDNASDGPTRTYLEALPATCPAPVTVRRNAVNEGFVKAANAGIRLSTAPAVCLLNNDTVVTDGWLAEMRAALESADDIGIVNPSSNNLGQRPRRGESIDAFAARLGAGPDRTAALGAATGFCMMIRRTVIERIGGFDEVYGMGNFEDTDLSRRAAAAGFRCVRACRAYVHHREGSSFGRSKSFDGAFAANRAVFEARWGRPKRIVYLAADPVRGVTGEDIRGMAEAAARGDWVHVYARRSVDTSRIPDHSHIVVKRLPDLFFGAAAALKIAAKKKRFDEVRRCAA